MSTPPTMMQQVRHLDIDGALEQLMAAVAYRAELHTAFGDDATDREQAKKLNDAFGHLREALADLQGPEHATAHAEFVCRAAVRATTGD